VGVAIGSSSRRGTTFVAAMERAGIEARLSPDIRLDLWRKFLFLDPLAAACGLVRGPIGAVRASARGRDLLAGAVNEVVAVGLRSGVPWSATDRDDALRSLEMIPEGTKPSFLLDVERGGPNELEILAGTVARLGREFGVPTPVHDEVVATLGTADYGLRPTADYGLRTAD
jgi:2-dehydropantoate 2-reductase